RIILGMTPLFCLVVAAMWWFNYVPIVFPESDGLSFRLYHEIRPYRYIDARQYFGVLGFQFGKGWMGGMQAGRGQFMYHYWWLVIPYWFCALTAGTLFCFIVARIRRRLRHQRGKSRVPFPK
ncbi:MAG: hypothetical protein JWN51_3140, partial [Phycisphaerales bacterium]|nr:hypothetical protein [Phycisphaerales bacterium]